MVTVPIGGELGGSTTVILKGLLDALAPARSVAFTPRRMLPRSPLPGMPCSVRLAASKESHRVAVPNRRPGGRCLARAWATRGSPGALASADRAGVGFRFRTPQRCGRSVLRSYLREGRMPPLDKALAMALAAGVSVDWLATGTSPPVAAQVRPTYGANPPGAAASGTPLPDLAVLERILEAVLPAEENPATPARLAAEVVGRYRRAMSGIEASAGRADD